MTEPRRVGGRFRLDERVGQGAAGLVYRGVDEDTGAAVAVKLLVGGTEEVASESRFFREARILRELESPYVVRFVAEGRDDAGQPYLVTEWLHGEDLAKRMRRAPLTPVEIRRVLEHVALGLGALHRVGVVHRDVKPANLVVNGTDEAIDVKVIDLGVAFAEAEQGMTLHGMMIGTPHYMSPEQVLGAGVVTGAADVFSLGVLAFELIAGERPYRAADVFGVVARIALEDPPRLSSLMPDVPFPLDAFVARAMAKAATSRFPTMDAFVEALELLPKIVVRRREEDESEEPTRALSGLSVSTTERRVVTAIFARSADDTEAARVGAAFEGVAAAHGGVSHRLLSILHVALFGGSLSTGDEAERAARAALALSKSAPGTKLALATGRALPDIPAQPGDVVERCARLLEGAVPGSVRIDDITARLVGERFEIGVDGEARTLLGERQAVAVTARTFLGRETACVGRDRELAILEGLYADACTEKAAKVAIVTGDAGVGKSRLRHELLRRIGARRPLPHVLFGRASVMTEGSPFALVGGAIRGFARIALDEPAARQREKLGATVRSGKESSLIPLLARIASIPAQHEAHGHDGVLETDRLKLAFETWWKELLDTRPLVVVLEDLHWGDAPSVALVESALRNLSARPILVVALGRPSIAGRFPGLWSGRDPVCIELGKLGVEAALARARDAVGEAVSDAVLARAVSRADGNAFQLEELLRRATEDPEHPLDLPETVLAMMQARLDRLGPEPKRLLKAASVLGGALWPAAIVRLLGEQPERVEAALTMLTKSEVLERRPTSRFAGDSELVFRHELLREAAYELLGDTDRELLHLRAAEWLEERGESDAIGLARHFERGRAKIRALPYWEAGAEHALAGSDFANAIAAAENALACGASGPSVGNLALLLAEASRWRGDLERALAAASQASDAIPRGTRSWFGAMRERVAAHGRLGHKDKIAGLADEVLAVNAASGAVSAQIAALVPAAVHVFYGGDLGAAEHIAARIEALAAAFELEPLAKARLHQLRAALAPAKDDIETAIVENGRAVLEFDRAGDMRARTLASSNLGFGLLSVGQFERAEEVLRDALDASTRLGLGTIAPLALQNLGVALASVGRTEEAIRVQREARDRFIAGKDPRLEAASRLYLARCHLEQRDLDAALEEAATVERSTFDPMRVGALAILSEVARARGDVAVAVTHAESAILLLDTLGAVEDLELFTRLAHAEALAAAGRRPAAMAALRVAKSRLVARADKLRDPALRASFLGRVSEHARILELVVG